MLPPGVHGAMAADATGTALITSTRAVVRPAHNGTHTVPKATATDAQTG